MTKMKELSAGIFQSEIHDMLVSDRHAMALATQHIQPVGADFEYRSVQVWRFENGSLIEAYEYLRNFGQFQLIWGAP